ncbi:DALR anticodon-binding domain-containing protein [Paenibacillus sp. FJAT-26967]|uniref:DALR anticodon-binding domain-containing protein n=1 Tax=Paenibacillus sp. FJAT-26967 TaxID=1729690 RepID=UPI000B33BBFA
MREGFWEETFALLKQTEVFYKVREGKLAGCWVLKHREEEQEVAASEADEEYQNDKILVRSNGILTYTAKDIAYHLWKFGLLANDFRYKEFTPGVWTTQPQGEGRPIGQADTVVNVIDHRQEYPQAMVKQALEVLGYEEQTARLKHVSYGVVSLSHETAAGLGVDISEGRSSYPMSGRQGVGIKVAELLDRMEHVIDEKRSRTAGLPSRDIAAASIRYYLLKYHLQTEVVFDLQQATEVSGNSGVYLLYAHARACSVLQKAKEEKGDGSLLHDSVIVDGEALQPQELSLLRHLAYGPEIRGAAARQLAPNILCGYAYELALLFSNFYSACPILKGAEQRQSFRLWLTSFFKDSLEETLHLLGLPAPEKM